MSNESLRQIHPNGLPEGFVAMSDAKVELVNPEDPTTYAVSARLVVTDPGGGHHAVILQFFWDGMLGHPG